MNVLDLFSGIGGFSLGLERAGMKTVAFCENDKECRKVLDKNFKGAYLFNDVKHLKVTKDGTIGEQKHGSLIKASDIDIICGGFPCQDISVAGKGKGFEDEKEILSEFKRDFVGLFGPDRCLKDSSGGDFSRLCEKISRAGGATKAATTRSGLWKEYIRIIKEVKPRYAIVENVANLRGNGLAQIIKDLWSIGYACEWHIVSARSIGAPHLRERIWIIAYPENKTPSNACSIGLQRQGEYSLSQGNREESKEGETINVINDSRPKHETTNSNNFRFWKPFTSEEESQRWWAKTSSSVSHWEEVRAIVCGVDDGISRRLHTTEAHRRERLKQLGNTVLPQIPEILGRMILEYEARK